MSATVEELSKVNIACYQTCKADSQDWKALYESFPHHAVTTNTNHQWLGNGYYFWTDSPTNAVWWGEERLGQPYCITRYNVNIEYDLIFDMTGNVQHIEYFKLLKDKYMEKYEQARRFSMGKLPAPSISTVIQYFRSYYREQMFAFRAAKIHHNWIDQSFRIVMSPQSREFFSGLPRIQLCIFTDEKECVEDKTPHYPPDYCDSIARAA